MTFPKAFQINTLLSDGALRTQDASRQAEASPRMCMCVCVCVNVGEPWSLFPDRVATLQR